MHVLLSRISLEFMSIAVGDALKSEIALVALDCGVIGDEEKKSFLAGISYR
jgi:hypothetical protein